MSRLLTLPQIMLAPNGARRTKDDHAALPVTILEVISAAKYAFDAGAHALHAHVRDAKQMHVLDAGQYRELIAEMARMLPDMPVQITTETAGLYDAAAQRALVEQVMPEGVSVALREMWPVPGADAQASRFYHWAQEAGIAVQHILYSPQDVERLARKVAQGDIPAPAQCLFVLGSYTPPTRGTPAMLHGFLQAFAQLPAGSDWAACAFGEDERDCLLAAHAQGGKMRIGFENNLTGADGKPAVDNAAQVRDLVQHLG
ncbi:3-keto-5-aminohexanoate cleavage protein [Pararhodobacter oceanensis]|uniref:3-keto-5-aminohexanoate cleavage protein n=1 Tax=Pararhodobacter oceanensis TaxID=2172121 RepID=UPI003A8EB9CD